MGFLKVIEILVVFKDNFDVVLMFVLLWGLGYWVVGDIDMVSVVFKSKNVLLNEIGVMFFLLVVIQFIVDVEKVFDLWKLVLLYFEKVVGEFHGENFVFCYLNWCEEC